MHFMLIFGFALTAESELVNWMTPCMRPPPFIPLRLYHILGWLGLADIFARARGAPGRAPRALAAAQRTGGLVWKTVSVRAACG